MASSYDACPDNDCGSDRVVNQGPVVEMKTRRTYFLDYPCDLKPDEKVTFVLCLHGAGSYGNWQRHYFPIMDYKDKYRLVIATPSEIYFTISAFPTNAHVQAERKAAQKRAPAFLYQIRWRTPVEGGRRLSPHCIEIPFAMQNVWQLPEMVGTGAELQPLADKVSGAWVAFARTGNPSHAGIPKWPAYDATERRTMHIDNEWTVASDPNRDERLAMAPLPRLPMF